MSKYGNRRTEAYVTGFGPMTFDSQREATRAIELALLFRARKITDLQFQPRFACVVETLKVCDYVADFSYRDEKGELVVEDAKGVRTSVYMLKKKLVKACHGIEVREV